jgi:hypothetical protein
MVNETTQRTRDVMKRDGEDVVMEPFRPDHKSVNERELDARHCNDRPHQALPVRPPQPS